MHLPKLLIDSFESGLVIGVDKISENSFPHKISSLLDFNNLKSLSIYSKEISSNVLIFWTGVLVFLKIK